MLGTTLPALTKVIPAAPPTDCDDHLAVLWCVMNRDISQAIAWMRASEPYAFTPPGNICRAARQTAGVRRVQPVFVARMRSDARVASPKRQRAPAKPGDHDPIAE